MVKKFFKYLLIGLFSSNIPWIGWGMIFGFHSILLSSLVIAYIDKFFRSKSEVFLITGTLSSIITLLVFFVTNALNHEQELVGLTVGLFSFAIPSIFIASIISTLTFRLKLSYQD